MNAAMRVSTFIGRWLFVVVLVWLLMVPLAPARAAAQTEEANQQAAEPAPFCPEGQAPEFWHGLLTLSQHLGVIMGDPRECEHAPVPDGDSLQATTRGLAFYRKSTNTPTFTDGHFAWALTGAGLQCWVGNALEPPEPPATLNRFSPTQRAEATAGSPESPDESLALAFSPTPYDVTAADILFALSERCFPHPESTVYSEETDPELGQPGGYLSRADFSDSSLYGRPGACAAGDCALSEGGAIEVYLSPFQAQRRAVLAGGIARGNVVLRLSEHLHPVQVQRYHDALHDILGD